MLFNANASPLFVMLLKGFIFVVMCVCTIMRYGTNFITHVFLNIRRRIGW